MIHQMLAWSPDGSRIAYSELDITRGFRRDKWDLKVIPVNGGEPTTIANGAPFASWSPDGKQLVYAIADDSGAHLEVAVVGRGERRQVSQGGGRTDHPTWSPDGQSIAFSSDRDGSWNLYIVDLQSGTETRLTDTAHKEYNPSFSPDGAWIAYFQEKGDNQDQIWLIRPDGSDAHRFTDGTGHNIYPGWHPKGDMTYSTVLGDTLAVVVRTGLDTLQPKPFFPLDAMYVRYAPDGKHIAGIINESGRPRSSIVITDADGKNARKLVN